MKKLHKTAAVALALGMMFSSVPMVASANTVAVAAGDMTQERAIELAKTLVTLPTGFVYRQASYQEKGYTNATNNSIWQVSFSNENPRLQGWISVVIDAKTGVLLSMDSKVGGEPTSFDNTISRDAAREKALAYLKTVAGDKLKSVREFDPGTNLKADPLSPIEPFRFVRIVNGLPYAADGFLVEVAPDGKITNYTRNWNDELMFPKATPTITAAQAVDACRKSLKLELQYNRYRKSFATEDSYQLVYSTSGLDGFNGRLPQIDADAGVAIGLNGKALPAVTKTEWKPITDQVVTPQKKDLTKEQALEIVKTMKLVPADYTFGNASFESQGDSKVWRFEFEQGKFKEEGSKHMMVHIDATTGELVTFFRNGDIKPASKNPAITIEQAQQKAIELVKTTMASKANTLALAPTSGGEIMGSNYSVNFVSLIDGIPTSNMITRVMIDQNTGEIDNVYSDSPTEVKDKANKADAMSREDALNKFVDKYKLEPQYLPVYDTEADPYMSQAKSVKLVYAPAVSAQLLSLDAVTGQWTLPWGGEPAEKSPVTDIKGHWAEKQLQFMTDRGIFEVKDGKVDPNALVSRGDMVRYLILALNGPRMQAKSMSFADVATGSGNYDFIEEAVARKWLDKSEKNFRPDDAITRAELSEFIATALGYKKLSESENTFKSNYSDVSEKDKRYFGDIAVVSALGILTGNNGKFGPNQSVTRAQAAVVITRVLDQYKNSIINYNFY